MNSLLPLIPLPWRMAIAAGLLVAMGGAFGLGLWQGYARGYASADNKGRAALATLRGDYERLYADELEKLNARLREQAQAALQAGDDLTKAKVEHEKKASALRARIARVTRDSKHSFSPNFVRLWNEATGAALAGDAAASGPAGASESVGAPGAGKAADAGLLARGSVSEADILAYMAWYGKRAQNLEAQVNALITIVEDLQREPR